MAVSRRKFLQAGAALSLAGFPRPAAAGDYRVGIGRDSHPYAATMRAIDASAEFPDVLGRLVVVKPNLMMPADAATGATTDPEVTRAVVDRALSGGAARVFVTETAPPGAHFGPTGHTFFASYHTRVRLTDVKTLPVVLKTVPGGGAYNAIYVPDLYVRNDIVFISVAKLKTHEHTVATLSLKNLFGIPAIDKYISFPSNGRYAMHDRDLTQTILDLNRLRPIHYAVVDGMVGMEGEGPAFGSPVKMDVVLAGRNAVAVDRAALGVMDIPQNAVRYLSYASRFGLGPADLSSIDIVGDSITPRAFTVPVVSPPIEYPRLVPSAIRAIGGQRIGIAQWYGEPCARRIQIVRLFDENPSIEVVRTVADVGYVPVGTEWAFWDGRDSAGALVPPGQYAVHVRAFSLRGARHSNASTWVTVTP